MNAAFGWPLRGWEPLQNNPWTLYLGVLRAKRLHIAPPYKGVSGDRCTWKDGKVKPQNCHVNISFQWENDDQLTWNWGDLRVSDPDWIWLQTCWVAVNCGNGPVMSHGNGTKSLPHFAWTKACQKMSDEHHAPWMAVHISTCIIFVCIMHRRMYMCIFDLMLVKQ